jgi:hypothetical protein
VTVPYTEFTAQIEAKNIGEIFARGDTTVGVGAQRVLLDNWWAWRGSL